MIRTHGDFRKEVDKIMGITTPIPKKKEVSEKKELKKMKDKMQMYKKRYEHLLKETKKGGDTSTSSTTLK